MMSRPVFLLCAGLLCGAALLGCPAQPPAPPVTTTTTLAPTPEPCVAPVPGPAGDYVPVDTLPTQRMAAILEAREAIGRYTCWPDRPDTGLDLLAEKLREMGLCAVKTGDRVMVQRPDALFEEWHALRFDTGCWASAERAYKGTLAFIGAAQ